MLIDKNLKTNPADIAEGFNGYFSSIAEKLLPKQTPGTKHFVPLMQLRFCASLILLTLEKARVLRVFPATY